MREFQKPAPKQVIHKKIDLDHVARSIMDVAEVVKINFPFESNSLSNIARDAKANLENLIWSLRDIADTIRINFPFEANKLLNIARNVTKN